AKPTDGHRALAAALMSGTRRAIVLGTLAQRHPAYSELKALAGTLASLSGASLGCLTEGPNSAGAYLAGAVPHRGAGGAAARSAGLAAGAMFSAPLKAYVLLGGIDPLNDFAVAGEGAPGAAALSGADWVVAATSHLSASLRDIVHVVLPIGSFAESSGTYVNVEGRWQSWTGAAKLVGESRPGWKVLRVLANLLAVQGIDYISSEEIRDALRETCGDRVALPSAAAHAGDADGVAVLSGAAAAAAAPAGRWVDIPPYQVDVLVRGSEALARTKDGHMTRDVI
ncbi:MAG: molybdopterin-dependent oxidoreductase, partial [Pseudomonadota bacterium]|nr:molybdopterin-dependent oxidoreductase [Pseudomonadota bacterium]